MVLGCVAQTIITVGDAIHRLQIDDTCLQSQVKSLFDAIDAAKVLTTNMQVDEIIGVRI